MKAVFSLIYYSLLVLGGCAALILSLMPMIGWWGGTLGLIILGISTFHLSRNHELQERKIKMLKSARLTSVVATLCGLILYMSCAGYSKLRWSEFEKTLQHSERNSK